MDAYLTAYVYCSLVASVIGIQLCSYVLYRLTTSPLVQTYLVCIIAAFLISYTLTLIEVCFILERNIDAISKFVFLGAASWALWLCGIWTLAFKYWQTAYEINFLFRMKTEALVKTQRRIYWTSNIVGYSINSLPIIAYSFCMYNLDPAAGFSMLLLAYGGQIYILCFLIDAMRRMDKIVKQMPILKKSEGMFLTAVFLFVIYFCVGVCAVIYGACTFSSVPYTTYYHIQMTFY